MRVTPVEIGDVVEIVDETYGKHRALVTAVHGVFGDTDDAYVPVINVVYVSHDEAKHDPYGRQVERLSSLAHFSRGPGSMPKPGRFWVNLGE